MTVSRVGSQSVTAISGTTFSATLPQTPTAGNLLVIAVTLGRSTSPTCTTPSGWTAGPAVTTATGTVKLGLFLFWKLATGSESNPSFTVGSSTSGRVHIEEWSGLDATSPHDTDSTGQSHVGSGTGLSLTDSITTSQANVWVWGALGEILSTTALTNITWTSPLAQDVAAAGGNSSRTETAAGVYTSSGAQSPSVTYDSSSGTAEAAAFMGFLQAAGAVTGTASLAVTASTASDPGATGAATRTTTVSAAADGAVATSSGATLAVTATTTASTDGALTGGASLTVTAGRSAAGSTGSSDVPAPDPFQITVTSHPPTGTSGARKGGGRLRWQVAMLQGEAAA